MLGLVAAALGMVLALLGDVAASRLGARRIASYGTSLLVGLSGTAAALCFLPTIEWPAAIIAVVAYLAWWFAFLNLVQSLESSLRVKILGAIRAAGGHISRAALADQYNDDLLLGLRLARLRAGGAVSEFNGRLTVVSPGLKAIAGLFRFLKKLVIGRTSEFGASPQ